MNVRKGIATVAALAASFGIGVSGDFSHNNPSVRKADPNMSRMVNCEDYDIQPCWTYDEGSYRIVLSYEPYKSVKLSLCAKEDGGPKLPCVWKRNNRVEKGQPVTRNVFWRM